MKLTNKVKINLPLDHTSRDLSQLMRDLKESHNTGYLVEGDKPCEDKSYVLLLCEINDCVIEEDATILQHLGFWGFEDRYLEILSEVYK